MSKPILTQQGLRASLYDAMEFGFKSCEREENIQMARSQIAPFIEALVDRATNLPKEILRVEFPARGKGRAKISTVLHER